MSIWYHLDVTAIAENKTAVAKFFNLKDSWDEVRTDCFEFSFGGKNAPSLHLYTIMEQNPDLIFLIKQSIECDTVQWFLMRFDKESGKQQRILIQDFGCAIQQINKKVLEEYTKEFPTLPEKHLSFEPGFEEFRWRMFLNDFSKAASMLNRAAEYEEMVVPFIDGNKAGWNFKGYDGYYDDPTGDNDFSHLEPDET